MKAYFISGLAADRRVFSKLRLPPKYEPVYLDWIPVRKLESIQQYASRMAKGIPEDEDFILIGLSFGGIIAQEIAKLHPPTKLILISSVSSRNSIPLSYRCSGALCLENLVVPGLMRLVQPVLIWFFGPLSPDSSRLIKEYILNADYQLVIWSIGKLSRWKNQQPPENIIHIHGNQDRVFPVKLSQPEYIIPGGHLCLFDNASGVNEIFEKVLT